MKEQVAKEYKDEQKINIEYNVTDVTPGFGAIQQTQKTSNRGFRYLGCLEERPERPRVGDFFYNSSINELEVYISKYYRGSGVPVVTGPINYNVGDYVVFNGDLWRAVSSSNGVPLVPSTPDWVRDNTVSFRTGQSHFYGKTYGSVSIPSGVGTKVGATSTNGESNDQSKLQNFQIEVPFTGFFLLIGSAKIDILSGDTTREINLVVDDGLSPQVLDTDKRQLPQISASTSGTDSLGGGISATTNINIGNIQNDTLHVHWFGKLEGGSIVYLEMLHDQGSDIQVEGGFTMIQ